MLIMAKNSDVSRYGIVAMPNIIQWVVEAIGKIEAHFP